MRGSTHPRLKHHDFAIAPPGSGRRCSSFPDRRLLWKASGYGEASAQGGRHRIFREQSESCPAAAVGLGKRIEQESRVIILRKYGSIFRQNVAQHLVLIRMIASGGIQIDLLDQGKIRVYDFTSSPVLFMGYRTVSGSCSYRKRDNVYWCTDYTLKDLIGENNIFNIICNKIIKVKEDPLLESMDIEFIILLNKIEKNCETIKKILSSITLNTIQNKYESIELYDAISKLKKECTEFYDYGKFEKKQYEVIWK